MRRKLGNSNLLDRCPNCEINDNVKFGNLDNIAKGGGLHKVTQPKHWFSTNTSKFTRSLRVLSATLGTIILASCFTVVGIVYADDPVTPDPAAQGTSGNPDEHDNIGSNGNAVGSGWGNPGGNGTNGTDASTLTWDGTGKWADDVGYAEGGNLELVAEKPEKVVTVER
jgi:hypothetical protein